MKCNDCHAAYQQDQVHHQMSNSSPVLDPVVFELEGFYVAPGYGPFLFLLTLCNFLLVAMGNGAVMVAVATDRRLQRPMFVLIVNLALVDVLGATAVSPGLMAHFLFANRPISSGQVTGPQPISYQTISHGLAIVQAFTVHTYGVAVQTILAAMAYDRYVAVCEPLRYQSIMTPVRLFWLCFCSWFTAVVLIGVLFGLHSGTRFCGTLIQHVYCSNRAILQLACNPTPVNDIYGLVITWCVSSSVFLIIAFSYVKILVAAVCRGSKIRSKAVQTCVPHLVVYVLYEVATLIIIISYRFPMLTPNTKKLLSILFIIVPPALNPLIYGLVSHELRSAICRQLRRVAVKRQS